MPLTILGHWNMQNMSRNYTVVQGKNTDDRVKKKTYLCGQTGHRGCYIIKKLAFLDLNYKGMELTLYILTLAWMMSIMLFIHLLWHSQEDFVKNQELFNWGQFINPYELMFDSTVIPW